MARGGARPGAGRKRGSTGIKTKARLRSVEEMQQRIEANVPGAFKGDAHAFLVSIYKDPEKDFKDRLAAATAAAPYEKPKLAAVEIDANVAHSYEEKLAQLENEFNGADEHAH